MGYLKHCWCLCGKSLKTDLFGPSQTKLSDKLDDNLIVSSFRSLSLQKFNPNWNENGIQSTKSTHFTLSNLITFLEFLVSITLFLCFCFMTYMRISLQPKVMKIAVEGKRGAKVIFWRFKGWMIHFLFVDICDNFRVLPTGKMSNDPIRYRKSKKQKCGSVGCFENNKSVYGQFGVFLL